MNSYVLNDLVNSIELAVSELKEYRDELKNSDDDFDNKVSKDITKALKSVNLKQLIELVNSI